MKTAALVSCFWLAVAAPPAIAGGGPENVFLLVNVNSESSKTIANHYIKLRQIPPGNVLYVDWRGKLEVCSGKGFRNRILLPALKAIEERRLLNQIDYLVYSSDFPWQVNLQPLFPEEEFPPEFRPIGSLTGLTYLAPYLVGEDPNPALINPAVNWYVPGLSKENLIRCTHIGAVESRGFRSQYRWDRNGNRMQTSGKGQRYLLSTFLGITQGRGNTVEEVVNYLRRDAAADGTRPRGTIYFVENDNVRSDVRSPCFAEVAAEIQRLGVRARVIEGKLPQGAPDVMGIMAGAAQFNVAAARNVILPGAICEHLTSAGGNLRADVKQTPLTDFLRFGAAGASGTVVEPRAMQAKFPLPSLHLHYVRGCSLAEAFYQSVSGPYQLLIVGDPLCQPWAVPPTVTLDGLKPNQEVRGQLTLTPGGTAAPGRRLGRIEVTIDGRLVARTLPGQSLTLNTAKLADGYHELRVIGVHDDAIETRGRLIVPFVVKNTEAVLEVSIAPQGVVGRGSTLRISARQHGAQAIVIRQNSRELGRIEGEAGALEIPAASLGRGPTALQAISEGPMPFASKPIVIEVQ